jgi:hypothetical protein
VVFWAAAVSLVNEMTLVREWRVEKGMPWCKSMVKSLIVNA